jgi:hypothetical protein
VLSLILTLVTPALVGTASQSAFVVATALSLEMSSTTNWSVGPSCSVQPLAPLRKEQNPASKESRIAQEEAAGQLRTSQD